MQQFVINQVLIYNPTLKSKLRKPIQSDIQQAKVMAFYPISAVIQQKCNVVGMAEGVYEFCRSLQPNQKHQNISDTPFLPELDKALNLQSPQKQQFQSIKMMNSSWDFNVLDGQVIIMDCCALVLKQFEENIWIFAKIQFTQNAGNYTRKQEEYEQQQPQEYLENPITEDQCLNILTHFYTSFLIFYGKFERFLSLDKLNQLNQILDHFILKYHLINSAEEAQPNINELLPLNISNYLFTNIRAIPLDTNTNLKFQYFKNVLQSYDSNIIDLMVFANGYLAYSSTNKELTQFFSKYLYGMGQPYKFQGKKVATKFEYIKQSELNSTDLAKSKIRKYGLLFNSKMLGIEEKNPLIKSSIKDIKNAFQMQQQEDLLGITVQPSATLPIFQIHSPQAPHQKYFLNYYSEKKIAYLTLYKKIESEGQILFQNRFFHDNTQRFSAKISDILTNISIQTDSYRFLYCNCSTGIGKSTLALKNKQLAGPVGKLFSYLINSFQGQRYIIQNQNCTKQKHDGVGSIMATTYKDYWIYGVKRMNRMLVLLIPSEVSLQKLDDFANKMTKEYFAKAYL